MANPPHIVLYANINPDAPNAGSLHVAGLAGGFAAAGYRVQLVVPGLSPDSELRKILDDSIELYPVPRARISGFRTIWSLGTVLAIPRLLRLLMQNPHLLYVRNDHSTWLLHALSRLMRIRSIGEHNSLVSLDRDPRRIGGFRTRLFDLGQRLACRLAWRTRAVTEGIKNELVARGADAQRIFVAGNGTDLVESHVPSRAECLRQIGLPQDRIYVGFFGHLVWWQGCDQLLAAFVRAHGRDRRLCLLFAGAGPMRDTLSETAMRSGLDADVRFLGPIPYERRVAMIGAFDIACFTGVARRNVEQGVSPLKIRDYAACGRAILSAGLPGLEDMEARGAVLLYKPDDIADLEEKLIRLSGDEILRRDLGSKAQHYARENFAWRSVADTILRERFETLNEERG